MKKQKTIAVAIDPTFPAKRHHEVMGGIQDYAEAYHSLTKSGGGGWFLVNDLFPEVAIERYDGVIGRMTKDLARATTKAGIPAVNTWFSSPMADEVPGVLPHLAESARMAADHLIARGFKSFAYAGFANKADRVIRDAFTLHLREAGFSCRSVIASDHVDTRETWVRFSRRLENWLESWRADLPVGVFSRIDAVCHHLLTLCKNKGISVPHDVALVSGNNEPAFCLLARPTITSIDYGYKR
ncbi:MAG: substrate-binding domain-containing protein, partial [Verrucomicrobiota bacterium]